jgi:hypothetical protein
MVNKYNDGLDNETVRQIITTYRRPMNEKTKVIINDLGTVVGEKNSNSNLNLNLNKNINLNKNTFRPGSDENDGAPEVRCVPEKPLVAEPGVNSVVGFGGVMAAQPKIDKMGYKRISTSAIYTEINVQISNVRDEGKNMRCRVYVSLKESTDKQYSVFLSGAMTTSKYELVRGAKENQQVLGVINSFKGRRPDSMVGRLRYKPLRGFASDFHKKNLKSALIMIYENNGMLEAEFYLLGEFITIPLDQKLSLKQQKYYDACGIYRLELGDLSDEEEFE